MNGRGGPANSILDFLRILWRGRGPDWTPLYGGRGCRDLGQLHAALRPPFSLWPANVGSVVPTEIREIVADRSAKLRFRTLPSWRPHGCLTTSQGVCPPMTRMSANKTENLDFFLFAPIRVIRGQNVFRLKIETVNPFQRVLVLTCSPSSQCFIC